MRRLARVGIAAVIGTCVFGVVRPAASAPAAPVAPGPCPPGAGSDYCVGNEVRPPARPPGGSTTRPVVGRPAQPAPCGWSTVTEAEASSHVASPPPAGEAVTWQAWCIDAANPGGTYGGPYRWVLGAPVVTPLDIATGLYQQIQGRMPDPAVVTNPPLGVASVVDVPVFVSISNWQPSVSLSESLAGVPVTVSATPLLLFNPGDGSGAKSCTGPGRRFSPGGGDLWDQARAADACTHIYRQRTGAVGRPAAWPGVVTVRWSISWSAGDGSGGTFPSVDRTTPVPRSVEEVQSVVVSGG